MMPHQSVEQQQVKAYGSWNRQGRKRPKSLKLKKRLQKDRQTTKSSSSLKQPHVSEIEFKGLIQRKLREPEGHLFTWSGSCPKGRGAAVYSTLQRRRRQQRLRLPRVATQRHTSQLVEAPGRCDDDRGIRDRECLRPTREVVTSHSRTVVPPKVP